jgi:hypothetical protein
MSWVVVAITVTAGSTYVAMETQAEIAENNIKQGEMDQRASANATKNAEEAQKRRTADRLSQSYRELLSARSEALAIQAETGVAGAIADKQKRNIDMQNTFDIERIQQDGEALVHNVRTQGFQNTAKLQQSINSARSNKPSDEAIAFTSATSSALAGLRVSGSRRGGKS